VWARGLRRGELGPGAGGQRVENVKKPCGWGFLAVLARRLPEGFKVAVSVDKVAACRWEDIGRRKLLDMRIHNGR